MANFADILDGDELDNKYAGKVIVYVEAEADANLFNKLIGPGWAELIEFKVPPVGGAGCGPAKARVKIERQTNSKVFALIDGEAAVEAVDGFDKLLDCSLPIFVTDDPELEGVLFIGEHEVENILLRKGDLCNYIVADTTLSAMGRNNPADVRLVLERIVALYLLGALCKYASARLHSNGQMSGILDTKIFGSETSRLRPLIFAKLKEQVEAAQGSWDEFRNELKDLIRKVSFKIKSLDAEHGYDERARLADGKAVLKKIKNKYGINSRWEGHLASEIAKLSYASEFRENLFSRTGIQI
ncbi:TPA: hypothetical protein N2A09_005774 [Pseudomonas aeruginosa]|nr:hypothetical protein [Pseudomonas aeruginosa]